MRLARPRHESPRHRRSRPGRSGSGRERSRRPGAQPIRGYLGTASIRALAGTLAALLAATLIPATAAADAPDDAAVYAWGINTKGQLGDGSTTERHEPIASGLPAGVQVSKLATEAYGALALTTDGQVYGWGTNQCWQLAIGAPVDGTVPLLLDLDQPAGTRITDIAAGYTGHRLALTSEGSVIAWGADSEGQAGNGPESHYCLHNPVVAQLPAGARATAIAAGYDSSYAITSDNRLYTWGRDNRGQLGDGPSIADQHTPVPVDLPADAAVLQVVAGRQFAAALTADGTVYAWGSNFYGQLGSTHAPEDPHATPEAVPVPPGMDITQLSANGNHLLALTADGAVLTWGNGNPVITEVSLPGGVAVRSVQAGGQAFDLALTTTGVVLAWGQNSYGRLGDGTTTDRPTPVAVHLPTGAPVVALAAGWWHSMAVTSPFGDVTAANPFGADINWQLRYGITQGFGDGTFRPTSAVTRGQMAIYLYRYAHGGDDAPGCGGTAPFTDVAAGSVACGAIAWLKAEGLAEGDDAGLYHPGRAVSRQIMAAFLYRYYQATVNPSHFCLRIWYWNGEWYPIPPPFPDIAQDSPFWCAVTWLAGAQPVGITGGYPDGNFRPTRPVSRQTMAAFLHRYFTDFYGYGAG